MTAGKTTATTALLFGAFLVTVMSTAPLGQAPAPAGPAVGGRQGGAGAPQPAAGRGRGRGNAAQTLYNEHCGGCHGEDAGGGRAPSLFDEVWLKSTTDEQMIAAIRDGVPNTEMEPFGKALTGEQIWSLVNYIRTFTGNLRPRPEFVENPGGTSRVVEKKSCRTQLKDCDDGSNQNIPSCRSRVNVRCWGWHARRGTTGRWARARRISR
jgi:mono/diheme cytochrome c family protein